MTYSFFRILTAKWAANTNCLFRNCSFRNCSLTPTIPFSLLFMSSHFHVTCKDPHRHKIRVTIRFWASPFSGSKLVQESQQSRVPTSHDFFISGLLFESDQSKILKNFSEVLHFTTVLSDGGTLPIDVGRIHSEDSFMNWITAFHGDSRICLAARFVDGNVAFILDFVIY